MTDQRPGRGVRLRLVEAFAALNLAFLSFDIWLAHSANSFANPLEWIPVPFGAVAVLMVPGIVYGPLRGVSRWLGFAVGLLAMAVGLAGTLLHLDARFFEEQTLNALVYTAPFAAPLSYVGVGLLTWLNRLEGDNVEWGAWVVLLAWGGFIGNFVLSLLDHAQNGFFYPAEWIPVGASAFGVGFLLMAVLRPADRTLLLACLPLLAIEAGVGVVGVWLHVSSSLHGPMSDVWENLIYGAPLFAPLLLPNVALLAGVGLWDMLTARSGR